MKKTIFSFILLIIPVLGVWYFLEKKSDTVGGVSPVQKFRSVSTLSVGELSYELNPLVLSGEVRAVSRAEIIPEVSGRVLSVHHTLGEYITGGTLIAEIENEAERATVLQAEASLTSAEASLKKILSGARDEEREILLSQKDNSELLLSESLLSLKTSTRGAYVTADDAIRNKVDPLFSDPRSENPRLNFDVNNFQLETDIVRERAMVEIALKEWEVRTRSLEAVEDVYNLASDLRNELANIQLFLDNVALAVNSAESSVNVSQGTIDAWKTNVSLARTSLSASRTALSGAQEAYSANENAFKIATKKYEELVIGAREEDVSQVRAIVLERQATVQSAKLRLEKTFLRSPISGTIDSLTVAPGKFIQAFSSIGSLSNDRALEVIVYVTERNSKYMTPGVEVVLGESYRGIVTKISPSIDTLTKKIEVRISVMGDEEAFINGQSVVVSVPRDTSFSAETRELFVPLSALKITPGGTFVFEVGDDGTLRAHQVMTGNIAGGKVGITGVSPELHIVIDSRGLAEGERVKRE